MAGLISRFGTPFGLAARYVRCNPVRAGLVIGCLLLAFTSYALLAAIAGSFATSKIAGADSIAIGAAYGRLPVRYAQTIMRMPGIKAVMFGTTLGVECKPGVMAFLQGLGYKGENPLSNTDDLRLAPEQLEEWSRNRRALLVGRGLAQRCDWRMGELLSLHSLQGRAFKVRIIGLYHSNKHPMVNEVAWGHYRYLNAVVRQSQRGTVMWMNANGVSPGSARRLAARIDAHFATNSPPTESSVNKATQAALARFGNVRRLVEYVIAAVFVCTLLVTVNVAAHAAAERRRALAVLRVLGFSRPALIALFALEFGVLTMVGCAAGLGLGVALLRWVVKPFVPAALSALWVPSGLAFALAPAFAAGVLIVSLILPAAEALRVRPAQLTAL